MNEYINLLTWFIWSKLKT